MSVPTNRESEKYILRLPTGMRKRIKKAATLNNRTMNAEIVAALEEKFPVRSIAELVAEELGLDSILELVNTEKSELPAAIRRINQRMDDKCIASVRFRLRNGKLEIAEIGMLWTNDMATDESSR